jgi:hypothetical protein
MDKEQRAREDKALLNLLLEHPDRFMPNDVTLRTWTIGNHSSTYSALRLGRIIDEANAMDQINKRSHTSLACLIYEGVNNFEEESVFDYTEAAYTATLKDLRQNLFILKRENTADGKRADLKQQIVIVPETL